MSDSQDLAHAGTGSAALAHAVLGGGCFWCLEAVFQRLKGVTHVESGYANGHVEHPAYEDVCSGATGHAEVVKVQFDPAVISYRRLLEIFMQSHDPTTLNRQGADVGTQYRSGIYTEGRAQQAEALALLDELEAAGAYQSPVVTEVQALRQYFPAERYHQDYYNRHNDQPYCAFVIAPKLAKLRQVCPDELKAGE